MPIRTRTEGGFDTSQDLYTTVTFAGASSTSNLGREVTKVGSSKTTTDVVTPNFRSRVARGEIINNPFESWKEEWVNSFTPHIIRANTGSGSQIKTWTWAKGYSVPSKRNDWFCDISAAQAEASTEAAAKVGETSVDGTVEAGEARETMKMFSLHDWNLREHIRKEMRYAAKRGYVFPKTGVAASVLANNWLKYRYGIVPFLSLLNDTIVVGSRIRTRRETSRGFSSVAGDPVTVETPFTGSFHNGVGTSTKTWSSSVRAGILYEYKDFGNKYGFSLGAIPRAAWELTTLSFVMDWFANTGEFIGALTPRTNIVRRATWLGYETEVVYSYYSVVGPLKPSGYTLDATGSGSATQRLTGRRRVPFILAPTWYVRENALREIVTSKRIVDAFALTFQMFKGLMGATRSR